MRKNTSLSIPQRILLGAMFFVFLAGFSATGVLMVLKTTNKAATKDDSAPKEVVVEIAARETEKEKKPVDQTKTKATLLPQPTTPHTQPTAAISRPKGGTPLGVPSMHSVPATPLAPSPRSVSQPGNTLVFEQKSKSSKNDLELPGPAWASSRTPKGRHQDLSLGLEHD